MQTIQQPAIKGYRQLSEAEVALMNEAKALGEQLAGLIAKLRTYEPTPRVPADFDPATAEVYDGPPRLDYRWIAIGETHLQQGIMALVRAVAQPTSF